MVFIALGTPFSPYVVTRNTGCEKPADYKPSRLISSFTYQTRDFKGNEYIPLNLVDVKFEEQINDDIKKVTAGMNKDDLFIMIKAVNGYMTVKIQSDFRKYYELRYGYKSSYVLEHGPISKQWPIEGDWNITAKNECWSYGKWWYECWDSDDGDYYGWISEDELYLNVRGEK